MKLNVFFHMLIWHMYILFSKINFHDLCPFSNWIVGSYQKSSFESSLHTLDSHLMNMWLQIPVFSLYFHSLKSKIYNFTEDQVTAFHFINHTLGIRTFLPSSTNAFSYFPKSFISLTFPFKSMMHFELIFG